MSKYADEQVLVIKRALFDELGDFHGVNLKVDHYLPTILEPANNFFLQRDLAENDPSHKQIIPYAIFRHGDRFLHYIRGKKSGEQRLATKGSIGIGGHVNAEDFAAPSLERTTYTNGVEREVNEELCIRAGHTQKIIALLNDDTTEVGRVHLGVVHLFELDGDRVESNEDGICDLTFLTREELHTRRDQLETWSQICLDALDALTE